MVGKRLWITMTAVTLAVLTGCQQVNLPNWSCLPNDPAHGPDSALLLDPPDGHAHTKVLKQAAPAPEREGAVAGPQNRYVSTVDSPECPRRAISLAECLALALENGRTGEFYDRPGSDRRTSVAGLLREGLPSNFTDSIRVLAYDPAILATEIEQSLAKFDAFWQTSMGWNRVDPPGGLDPATVPAVGILNNNNQIDNVQFRTELLKPLATGGVAGLSFGTDYERANLLPGSPVLNPAYQPTVGFTFEQPLLRGAGVLINQLQDMLPGSVAHPALPVGGRAPGILLARIAHDESRLEFERRVQEVLFAVEEAYWELYCAYWDLYSRDSGMKLAHTVWQNAKARYKAGGITDAELAQIEEQFHFFRTQRLEALGRGSGGRPGVLEAERRLRYVVGLPAEDGTRLIPADVPAIAPVTPDWKLALSEAEANRPELVQVRQEIRAAHLLVARAGDLLRPDLRFISRYDVNGVGSGLGGGFHDLAHTPFSDWELRLQLTVPIGFREGHAEVTRARLRLAQRLAFLRDQESKLVLSLERSYRDLVQFREEMRTRQSQRQAAARQLKARFQKLEAAGGGNIEFLLQAQRTWADALRDQYVAICNYNVALADFERQKGTIMRHDNVTVADGPLPACAQERASAHIREFEKSLVLKEATGSALENAKWAGKTDPPDYMIIPEVVHGDHPLPVPAVGPPTEAPLRLDEVTPDR